MTSKKIIELLESNGFEAYFVGGHVRDILLGINSFDEDLVTNASVDEMINLFENEFKNIDSVGKRFGVLIVDGIEVAQYRTETYSKKFKPNVKLSRCLIEDSNRRDFTINSIYMDKIGNIIDPQNGKLDIENKIIRSVGTPKDRFLEDPSRIFRGIYLSSKLGFTIDDITKNEMTRNKSLLDEMPNELKGKIVMKSIKSGTFYGFIKQVMELGLMDKLFPELSHLKGLEQNIEYHHLDAWEHTLEVVKASEREKKYQAEFILGSLFHDNKKGTFGVRKLNKRGLPSDIGHEEVGAPIAKEAILRIGLGKDLADKVRFFVLYHGVRFENVSKRSIVRWIRRLSKEFKTIEDLKQGIEDILLFVKFDAEGFNEVLKNEVLKMLNNLYDKLTTILDEHIFYENQLPITGKDIVIRGGKGKQVGELLNQLVMLNVQNKERAEELLDKWLSNQ